jgi:hypothetical protein
MDDLSSVDRGPRQQDNLSQTGTGTPRSMDDGVPEEGAAANNSAVEVDPAIVVGATTSSQPASADDVAINRSGSGGTGGPTTDEDRADG